ncbi:TetR/AcrR family transcriptional regulator [Zhongshania aquimaris]|uniref:TetR/AcrR family transcriptional regulator n=1 Tax=Zhongshania aquimaris TaxID=2857107 RepID=A0ABS6VTF7_9GAMM|nr:TetR/AcrR family transcriptional regulator [Zhongshania aquimaris]MBW2941608.1 TetR/AcrR family transcriptional regulator [Zhongshania aquimaris]
MSQTSYQPHYSTTSDSRVIQTREAIYSAFLLLLDSKPLDEITIREIAVSAGIGYKTFFRHYTGKAELLNAIAADEIKRLIVLSVGVMNAANSKEGARALCRYVADNDATWSTLLNGGAAHTMRDEFVRLSREVAAGKKQELNLAVADIGVRLSAVGTLEMLSWWLSEEKRISVDELAELYNKLVIAPIMDAYSS